MTAKRQPGSDPRGLLRALMRRISEARGGDALIVRCAWCDRIKLEADEWADADDVVESHMVAGTSHGICPTCLSRLSVPGA
jgi:hypothetical protein